MPGFPVHHQLLEIAQTHVLRLEKEMATHSSILAWRIPGTEEPGGLLSVGSHRVSSIRVKVSLKEIQLL